MTPRFRMIAGPNGSGKSTLVNFLRKEYALNFYTFLNADSIFEEAVKSSAYSSPVAIDQDELLRYAELSGYDARIKGFYSREEIVVEEDIVRFKTRDAVNSYTIAILTNFLQQVHISKGLSFSQETVFSHPSKVAALKTAIESGFRTYLYFVANRDVSINLTRIANRVKSGGHDVPVDKVVSRAERALSNVAQALAYCSRAYFFDNSSATMEFLAEYEGGRGFTAVAKERPQWFDDCVLNQESRAS